MLGSTERQGNALKSGRIRDWTEIATIMPAMIMEPADISPEPLVRSKSATMMYEYRVPYRTRDPMAGQLPVFCVCVCICICICICVCLCLCNRHAPSDRLVAPPRPLGKGKGPRLDPSVPPPPSPPPIVLPASNDPKYHQPLMRAADGKRASHPLRVKRKIYLNK